MESSEKAPIHPTPAPYSTWFPASRLSDVQSLAGVSISSSGLGPSQLPASVIVAKRVSI